MGYLFTPNQMAIIKKTDNNETNDGEDMEELESSYTAGGNANGTAFWKANWPFLKKVNINLPYYLAIPFLGTYRRKMKIYVHTQTCMQL